MASTQLGNALRQIHRLYSDGTVAGLADAQLLERFLDHRDEAAFTALVERHGPMVLGTCRAVLKDPHHAEDAFQASFLLLVRKARSIRGRDSLGGWLHRVARRVAVEANAQVARRRTKECEAGAISATAAAAQLKTNQAWDDLHATLHAEVDRLPEQYRLPIVLCDLEGLSRDEAANRLSWTLGMVRGRLARARRLLRSRLTQRGLAPSLTVALVGEAARAAAVPVAWVAATAQAATRFATERAAPTAAASLAEATTKTVILAKLKAIAAASLTIAALGATFLYAQNDEQNVQKNETGVQRQSPPPAAPAPTPDRDGSITFRGRVLGPDGRAHEGARLFVFSRGREAGPSSNLRIRAGDAANRFQFQILTRGRAAGPSSNLRIRAASDANGRFQFQIPKSEFDSDFDPEPWRVAPVIAVADGLGLALGHGPSSDEELTLRLVADDVPIEGRVIDLQGRPIAGVTVRVLAVKAPASDDLTPWLDALKSRKSGFDVESDFLPEYWHLPQGAPIVAPVTSDGDGRFRIAGLGRERLANLLIEGPAVESAQVNAMTRAGETIRVPGYRHPGAAADVVYVGARFEHVAGPSRPIEGTVRDKATGQPLAGITIKGEKPLRGNPFHEVRTTTDEQGRYRLVGLPKGREGKLIALPALGQPYIRSLQSASGEAKAESVRLDIELTRGVRVTGRVTDRLTGRPLKARVEYFVFVDNPHLEEVPGFRWADDHGTLTDENGVYQLIALPGPGVVAARSMRDGYLMGVGAETLPDPDGNGLLDTHPYNAAPRNFNAIVGLNPAPGSESATIDLACDPGRSLNGTVIGPDGEPLPGAFINGLHDMGAWPHTPLESARFTLTGLKPGKPRFLQLFHPEKKLAGWLMVREDETTPPVVKLEAWGVVTGRLVDDDGLPRTDVQLAFSNPHKGGPRQGSLLGNGAGMSGHIVPDGDGRFRIEGLAPGLRYSLVVEGEAGRRMGWAVRDLIVKPGETRDLGDVRATATATKDPN